MIGGVGHAVGLEYFLDVPQFGLGPRRSASAAVLVLLPAAAALPPSPHVQLARAEQISWKERNDDGDGNDDRDGEVLALLISVGDYVAHSDRARNAAGCSTCYDKCTLN